MNKTRIILTHIVMWVIYITYELLTLVLLAGQRFNFFETLLNFMLYAALFYTNVFFLLPYFFEKKKYFYYCTAAILILGAFIGFRYQLKVTIIPILSDDLIYPFKSSRVFLAETLWRGGYFIMLSFAYWFAVSFVIAEQSKRKLQKKELMQEIEVRRLEKNMKDFEVAQLKHQINPHFLFNTLNFFYDKVRLYSAETAAGILILSDIMRYAITEGELNAKTMLEDEIRHIKNYIQINQLRFSNQLQVKFEVKGNPEYKLIVSLVLITFVENCFKHGDLFDPTNPVLCRLVISNDKILFITRNKKNTGPVERSTGIGLKNTIKRLDAIYADNYTLTCINEDNFYSTKLIIIT